MARRSTKELATRLRELIHEYDGKLSNAEAVGTLEIVKVDLITEANEEEEEDY